MTRKDRMYEDLAQNKYYDVKVGFVTFQAFVGFALVCGLDGIGFIVA